MGEHLRLRGKIWYGIVYVDGVREEHSTGCTSKEAARTVLEDWERDAADSDSAAAKTTLNDALNLLLEERRARHANGDGAKTTVSYYQTKAGHLVRLFGHDFRLALFKNSSRVWRYIDQRRTEGATDYGIRKDLVTLRAAARLAKERGLWSGDLDAIIPNTFRPEYKPKRRSPTREEVLKLLPHLLPNNAAVVAFMLATSAEMGAARRALRDDLPSELDVPGLRVHVRGTKTKYRDRRVPIVTDEQRELLEYAATHAAGTDGKLFGPLLNFRRDLIDAALKARVDALSAHSLRRAGGQWLIDLSMPLELVSRVMGHASTGITEKVYAKVKEEDLPDRMIDALDPRYVQRAHKARGERQLVRTIGKLPAPRAGRVKFIVNGVTRTLSDWARVSGISKATLFNRVLEHGMSMADAVALGRGGHGRRLPQARKSESQSFEHCRTGATDQMEETALSGHPRKVGATDNPQILAENGYARSDSNGRLPASKADALSS